MIIPPFVPSEVERQATSTTPDKVSRRRSTRTAGDAGFTLVEVMVALMIFGMIASAGVALLAFSVRAQAATTARLDDVGALARQSSLLAADLAQAVNRPARDERGTLLPAFAGDAASVTFVRAGWSNIDGQPRSTLQKVSYRLAGDTLERIAWPMVDGAAPLPPAAALSGIRAAKLRYRIVGAWSDTWSGAADAPLPQALELVFERKDGLSFRQLFIVGSGARPVPKAPENAT
ncbi:type II secretion system minor pseudopilin GspJ [Sphingomonas radiodurans]|uniref:type II secretion system minor pseudopilin GspJ n=1 Tax=Sphingomonas radiodurans TaxID=2890321 RepID=UPI001E3C0E44|nr:type II secretion system minor pseudopilin GspJ [Sphingomonas radiodurans]WBH16292.1 type II secretion system minor pseudopilin GspJ [Sphingomonas radiodurans]